jgi:ADP-ribose pyrophosphatase
MTVGKRSGRRVYSGKVINLDVDLVEFPNGTTGELEIFRHPGASAVVPFLSDPKGEDPQVMLIKQYRYAANGYLYEIPAGRLDPGEQPIDCARRELREETGCTAKSMEHLHTMFTTPGFTDEVIHIFMATELVGGDAATEADEFLTVENVTLSRALEMIRKGEIRDGKTVVGLLFAAGFIAQA